MKFSQCQPGLEHKMKPPKCLCNFFSILHLKNLPQNSSYSPIQKKMVTILRSVPEMAQNVLWGLLPDVTSFLLPRPFLTQFHLHPPAISGHSVLSSYMWSRFWQGKISPWVLAAFSLLPVCIFLSPFLFHSYFKLFLLSPLISLFLKHFLLLIFWIHSSNAL